MDFSSDTTKQDYAKNAYKMTLSLVASLYCSYHNIEYKSCDEYGVQCNYASGSHHILWEEVNRFLHDRLGKR